MEHEINLKRIYLPEEKSDGVRILVDRLWPRGESKARADLSEWDKQIAPTSELRLAFHHGKISFEEFKNSYIDELSNNPAAQEFKKHVLNLLETSDVTFLYSSKNEAENNAVVLRDWVENTD